MHQRIASASGLNGLYGLFARQAECSPERVALILGDTQITYSELDEKVNRLTNYLVRTGISKSQPVGVLLDRSIEERAKAGAVDYATMLSTAVGELTRNPQSLADKTVLLLDVAINSQAEAAFVKAVIAAARSVIVTVPSGDERTTGELGIDNIAPITDSDSALHRLQRHLFAVDTPPAGSSDDSVILFSAPGEGREAVEIARRLLQEAERGVPFDQMAILLRAPQTYLGVLEHALDRAGIPAWFHRGTRRPDPAGRALLALLACADEDLSARRFAEYVSLGQVPLNEAGNADIWSPPADDIVEAVLPLDERAEDVQPEDEAQAQISRGEGEHDLAGTLRAPWRWEDLIVEAAVIGRLDRWQRRLKGLEHEYDRRVREASSEDPEASRVRALMRDREQLRALRSFAEPILSQMADWPPSQVWGDWLSALERLAPRVIAKPERVLRMLRELAPLAAIGPVTLREVRDVLTPRLSTLTHEPPRRRHGRVFIGTPGAARARSFKVVFVVVNRLLPPRPTRMDCPGVAGLDGLIVATSNTRLALAAIGVGGAGGGGIVHAVVGVARARFSGTGAPCVKVPAIEFRSSLNRPSNVPPMAGIAILTTDPCTVTAALIGWPPWSMLYIRACHVWSAALDSCITIRSAGPAGGCRVPCHAPAISCA